MITWGASYLPPGLPSGVHAFSEIDRHSLSERAAFVEDSVAQHRGQYHLEDRLLGYPESERPGVLRRLRAGGYPMRTDSAYWSGFSRGLHDVNRGVYRLEVQENIAGWKNGPMVSELSDAVLLGWFGVRANVVQGHVCIQPVDESGNYDSPTCEERHAERSGYNQAVNLTVGLFFGHSDLLGFATERGIRFELER